MTNPTASSRPELAAAAAEMLMFDVRRWSTGPLRQTFRTVRRVAETIAFHLWISSVLIFATTFTLLPRFEENQSACYITDALFTYVECAADVPFGSMVAGICNVAWIVAFYAWGLLLVPFYGAEIHYWLAFFVWFSSLVLAASHAVRLFRNRRAKAAA